MKMQRLAKSLKYWVLCFGSASILFVLFQNWTSSGLPEGAASQSQLSDSRCEAHPVPLPPPPKINRDVAHVARDGRSVATPSIPALRTTSDGRIGLNVKGGRGLRFVLLRPEANQSSSTNLLLLGNPDNSGHYRNLTLPDGFELRHVTICEQSSTPIPNNGDDDYRFSVIGFTDVRTASGQIVRAQKVDIRAIVNSPKTSAAQFSRLEVLRISDPVDLNVRAVLEPMITSDGKLLVTRISGSPLPEFGNREYDVVYSYNTHSPCNIQGWTSFKPILHAHDDSEVKNRYGFARYRLRNTQNDIFYSGTGAVPDLPGTYPWIDRKGNNLFFYAQNSTLIAEPGQRRMDRFVSRCVDSTESCRNQEQGDRTRGLSVIGAWTHGKMVLLDGLLNNIDFGFGVEPEKQAEAKLYNDGRWTRLAMGRDNGVRTLTGAIDNITVVDSVENILNASLPIRPKTRRDVVWTVSRGPLSDEVVFDEYLNPYVYIYAPMNAALSQRGRYQDGFDSSNESCTNNGKFKGSGHIRIQNAATSPQLRIPSAGEIVGTSNNVRVEPVSLGGIHGRGLYLPGGNGLRFRLAPLNSVYANQPWYLGAHFDAHPTRAAITLFHIPGKLKVVSEGASLKIQIAGGTDEFIFPRSVLGQWSHVGLLFNPNQSRYEVYFNGNYFGHKSRPNSQLLANWSDHSLIVGEESAMYPGYWVDELKLILMAHDISSHLELACNHARGTIVAWRADAAPESYSSYSSYTRLNPLKLSQGLNANFSSAYCAVDYLTGRPPQIPAGSVSLRSKILSNGREIFADQPRPDFSANKFCISCHVPNTIDPNRISALRPAALTENTNLTAVEDRRRQPMMPPRWLLGIIPDGYIQRPNRTPAMNCRERTSACAVDTYLLR